MPHCFFSNTRGAARQGIRAFRPYGVYAAVIFSFVGERGIYSWKRRSRKRVPPPVSLGPPLEGGSLAQRAPPRRCSVITWRRSDEAKRLCYNATWEAVRCNAWLCLVCLVVWKRRGEALRHRVSREALPIRGEAAAKPGCAATARVRKIGSDAAAKAGLRRSDAAAKGRGASATQLRTSPLYHPSPSCTLGGGAGPARSLIETHPTYSPHVAGPLGKVGVWVVQG